MGLYKETIEKLHELEFMCELYRFQGGYSFECFNIKSNKFSDIQNGKFVYFSKSLSHHQYFTIRRIRQLINKLILVDTQYSVCLKNLMSTYDFDKICDLVIKELTGKLL